MMKWLLVAWVYANLGYTGDLELKLIHTYEDKGECLVKLQETFDAYSFTKYIYTLRCVPSDDLEIKRLLYGDA